MEWIEEHYTLVPVCEKDSGTKLEALYGAYTSKKTRGRRIDDHVTCDAKPPCHSFWEFRFRLFTFFWFISFLGA